MLKMRLNKKAVAAGFLVTIIITVAAFALIAGTLARFMSTFDDTITEDNCRTSIALRAVTVVQINKGQDSDWHDLVSGQLKAVPPVCKTIDKKINGNRELIKKQFADKMARCWWMFGEGRYDEILHGSDVEALPIMFGFEHSENECFNCYSMIMDMDEEELSDEGGPIDVREMERFLYNQKYPKLKDTTYLDYIQSFGGPGKVVFTVPSFEAGQAYAISMVPKNKAESSFWKGAAQYATGVVVVGAVVGAGVCIVATSGACAALVVPLATAAKVGAAGAAVGGYTVYSGYQNMAAEMFAERDTSMIVVDFLEGAQQRCGSGDIAGE